MRCALSALAALVLCSVTIAQTPQQPVFTVVYIHQPVAGQPAMMVHFFTPGAVPVVPPVLPKAKTASQYNQEIVARNNAWTTDTAKRSYATPYHHPIYGTPIDYSKPPSYTNSGGQHLRDDEVHPSWRGVEWPDDGYGSPPPKRRYSPTPYTPPPSSQNAPRYARTRRVAPPRRRTIPVSRPVSRATSPSRSSVSC